MEENNRVKKGKPYWHYLLRSVAIFFIAFIIKNIITGRITTMVEPNIPSQFFYAFAVLGMLLALNSLFSTFSLYDRAAEEEFKRRNPTSIRFRSEIKLILKTPEFWLNTLPVLIFTVIFSFFGGFLETALVILPRTSAAVPTLALLLSLCVLVPIFFFISLFSEYEIRRYRLELIARRETGKHASVVKFVLKLLVICVMYPLVFPYAPYLLFMLISFFALVGALVSILSVIGFIAAVAALIALIWLSWKLKVGRLKKRFIRDLTRVADENGYELTLFSKEECEELGYDFSLKRESSAYSCKFIYSLNSFVPLYFNSKNDAHFLYRLGTKSQHTSLEKHFTYSFDSEDTKLIVLIKFPRRMYVSEHRAVKRLYSGDKIWDYILYNTKDFLGSADRKCLYRDNST